MSDAPADEPVKLPPALDILWGRRTTGSRGPRAELDVDRIVEAAVRDRQRGRPGGRLDGAGGAALGFTTMSLYRHVANKEDLLQLMWNASARGSRTSSSRATPGVTGSGPGHSSSAG